MSSYFTRHKQALQQNKYKGNRVNASNTSHNKSYTGKANSSNNELKSASVIEDKSGKKQYKSPKQQSHIELSFIDERTQEQKVYEEYKQIKAAYEKQLFQLNSEIERIKKEAQFQSKKVKQAEIVLEAKKKQLKATKVKYQQLAKEFNNQQGDQALQNKITKLKSELQSIQQKNASKIKQLNEQEQKIKLTNQQLQEKLQKLERQYNEALNFDHNEFQLQKKKLQEQQQKLKNELQALEKQGQKIKKDIQKIQDMKPVSSDVHKKYLDLFQKMFITQELAKAQKIMGLKQQERKYNIELNRRNEWLKQKQKQIQQRQVRIAQKNKLVDKLTFQIREKSTLLLTKYQVEADKQRK